MRSNYREISQDLEFSLAGSGTDLELSHATSCSRAYSEGVRIEREGAVRHFSCASFLEYGDAPKNFKESVSLVLRLVPHEYCSTLIVDDPQSLHYFQEIRLKPKWRVRNFEETVFNYPKEALKRYVATLTYDPDSRLRTYVSGLTVSAAVNSADLGPLLLDAAPEPGHQVLQNGTEVTEEPAPAKVKLGFDENANLFCATKDVAVNGV